jgi:hypothetical protein
MTTYYNQIPTLTMRARAAALIVVGRITQTLRSDAEHYEGKSYLRETVEVQVERVLKSGVGAGPDAQTIAVQLLCGEITGDVAPKAGVGPENGTLLLMLSQGMAPGTYVPYLGSVFPVADDGRLRLGEDTAEKIGPIEAALGDERGITLDAVAGLIEEVVREEAAAAREPASAPPPATEMPVGHEGGGRSAQPEVLGAGGDGSPSEAISH